MKAVKLIAALDNQNGIAKNNSIPWHIPADGKYWTGEVKGRDVLVGWKTYLQTKDLDVKDFYVLSDKPEKLDDPKAEVILKDQLPAFMDKVDDELWVIGGVSVFELTLPYADALYITRVYGDFDCDRFFPYFGHDFHRIYHSEPQYEGDLEYQYEQWLPNKK